MLKNSFRLGILVLLFAAAPLLAAECPESETWLECWENRLNENQTAQLKAEETEAPDYHPPRCELQDHAKHGRIVVVREWQRGHVGMSGREWTYRVSVYRIKDGEAVHGEDLPQTLYYAIK